MSGDSSVKALILRSLKATRNEIDQNVQGLMGFTPHYPPPLESFDSNSPH